MKICGDVDIVNGSATVRQNGNVLIRDRRYLWPLPVEQHMQDTGIALMPIFVGPMVTSMSDLMPEMIDFTWSFI